MPRIRSPWEAVLQPHSGGGSSGHVSFLGTSAGERRRVWRLSCDPGRPSSLGGLSDLRTPSHLGTLGLGTFEVQHETLAQARVWGSGRCLELQREVGPRGEEAAARLRPSQLGQDSGAGTVPVEQRQHIPFAHIQAAGNGTRYGGWVTIGPPPIWFCPITNSAH